MSSWQPPHAAFSHNFHHHTFTGLATAYRKRGEGKPGSSRVGGGGSRPFVTWVVTPSSSNHHHLSPSLVGVVLTCRRPCMPCGQDGRSHRHPRSHPPPHAQGGQLPGWGLCMARAWALEAALLLPPVLPPLLPASKHSNLRPKGCCLVHAAGPFALKACRPSLVILELVLCLGFVAGLLSHGRP